MDILEKSMSEVITFEPINKELMNNIKKLIEKGHLPDIQALITSEIKIPENQQIELVHLAAFQDELEILRWFLEELKFKPQSDDYCWQNKLYPRNFKILSFQ